MLEYAELTIDDIVNANIDASEPATEWPLEGLVGKLRQYCYYFGEIDESDLRPSWRRGRQRTPGLSRREGSRRVQTQVPRSGRGRIRPHDGGGAFLHPVANRQLVEGTLASHQIRNKPSACRHAKKDPLIEYKLEGFNLYTEMMAQIRRNVIYSVYMFQPQRPEQEQETELVGAGAEKENSRKK